MNPHPNQGRLEDPQRRRRLLAQLSSGQLSMRELATLHGVSQQAISRFRERHAGPIAVATLARQIDGALSAVSDPDRRARAAALAAQLLSQLELGQAA